MKFCTRTFQSEPIPPLLPAIRLLTRFICITVVATWWLGGVMAFAADPAGDFLGAYQDFQSAEKLEREGDLPGALSKFQEAEKVLRGLSQNSPEWQPLVVEYRLKKTTESIARVSEAAKQAPSGSLDALEGELPTDRSPAPATTQRRPRSAPVPQVDESPRGSLGRQTARQRRQLQDLKDENARLTNQLARMRAELKSAFHEVDKRKTDVVELRAENRQLKDQLANSKKDSSALDETITKKDEEYAKLYQEQRRIRAERDVLLEENETLIARLEDAAEYITASEEIHATVIKERDDALAKVKKAKDSSAEVDQLTKDNKALAAKLTELSTRLKKAESEGEKKLKAATKDLEQLRKENETASKQIVSLTDENAALSTRLADLNERIKAVELEKDEKSKAVEAATAAAEQLGKEKEELTARLTASEERIREVEAERNDLLAKLDKVKADAANLVSAEVQKTQAEEKLAELEKRSEDAGQEIPVEEIQKLRSELNSARDELLAAQVLAQRKDTRISDLEKEVDQVTGELARLKLNPSPSEEDRRIQDENDLLRGLVLRQLKQASEIEKGRAALQEEIQRLQVKSETLDQTFAELAAGKVELTEEEKQLFKDPVVMLSNGDEDGQIAVEMAMTKPADSTPSASSTEQEDAAPSAEATPSPTPDKDILPAELKEEVQLAKELYEQQDFEGAERQYQKIISAAPENYYALTNLAVTQFHLGRLSAAEVALRKAVAIHPSRPDAYTILGIVNYRQGRFDDGVTVLTRAIELNDKDSAAHNYLGITLCEKGDSERAVKELKRAIELNPEYADAHFNLAVVYATAKPPKKDLAKEHYAKATSLGAPPDSSLERLIQ